jgi:acetyl esterase/lipase
MPFTLDPEFAAALAPMGEAMAAATPPAVGDVAGRRAMWEPILAAASTALTIPDDVTTTEVDIPVSDGATITARWYTKTGAPAALFFHGGGYIFGQIDQFDGPVSR